VCTPLLLIIQLWSWGWLSSFLLIAIWLDCTIMVYIFVCFKENFRSHIFHELICAVKHIFFFSESFYLFIFSFIHMCIHCLGHFSTLPHSPPQFQAGPVLPLSLILLKEWHKHNKEDKAFSLVKYSYTERFLLLLSCTHVLHPCWFNSNSMIFMLVTDPLLMITSVILRFLY
jgi:hypothetical protein